MAQNGAALFSICRSCRRQLKLSLPKDRTFANTAKRQKTIPYFKPTANEELDEIFSTFRNKYFTPPALAKHHRDLMYKPVRHQLLLNDPGVTVTLSDGEDVRLMPMNPHTKPIKKQALKRIAELLGSSNDPKRWNNLLAFLEGMQLAKERLPDGWLERIVRKANEMGRGGIIIRCAEMVKKTGVSLADAAVTRELLVGLHNKAANLGWQGEELATILKESEQLAQMLQDPRHCGAQLKDGQTDMRRDLTVLGVLLELAAAKAISLDGKKDGTRKVSRYLTRLLAVWENKPLDESGEIDNDLKNWIPLWHGLKLASQVEGVTAAVDAAAFYKSGFESLTQTIQQTRDQVLENADGKPRRCLQMYDSLTQ